MYKYSKILEILKNKTVELRHDVDISLISTYKMAKYEKELGTKSIYYIRFDSDYYNVLSHENYKIISFLIENHEIGCHVDVIFIKNITNKLFVDSFRWELFRINFNFKKRIVYKTIF